jgi:GTPase SAR1 family protein
MGESGAGKSFLLNRLFGDDQPKSFTEHGGALRHDTYKTECKTVKLDNSEHELHVIEVPPFNEFYGGNDYPCSALERLFRHTEHWLGSPVKENTYIPVFVLNVKANPRWLHSRKRMFEEFMRLYNTQSSQTKEMHVVCYDKKEEHSTRYYTELRQLIMEQCPEFQITFHPISSENIENDLDTLKTYLSDVSVQSQRSIQYLRNTLIY